MTDLVAPGASGTNPQNCSTDLMEFPKKLLDATLLPVYAAVVPMFVAKSENGLPEPELCIAGLLLPHMWFWFLHTHTHTLPDSLFQKADGMHGGASKYAPLYLLGFSSRI